MNFSEDSSYYSTYPSNQSNQNSLTNDSTLIYQTQTPHSFNPSYNPSSSSFSQPISSYSQPNSYMSYPSHPSYFNPSYPSNIVSDSSLNCFFIPSSPRERCLSFDLNVFSDALIEEENDKVDQSNLCNSSQPIQHFSFHPSYPISTSPSLSSSSFSTSSSTSTISLIESSKLDEDSVEKKLNRKRKNNEFSETTSIISDVNIKTNEEILINENNKNIMKKKKEKKKSSTIEKKEKKIYYVPVNRFPKILKRDFRRYFPLMLSNVMNSMDSELVDKFSKSFFMDNIKYTDDIKFDTCFSYSKSKHNTIRLNIENVSLLYFFHYYCIPDLVCRLDDNIKIIQRLDDKKISLVYDANVEATQLYEIRHSSLDLINQEFFLYDDEEGNNEKIEKKKKKLENMKNETLNQELIRNPLIDLYHSSNKIPSDYLVVKNTYRQDIIGDHFYLKKIEHPRSFQLNLSVKIVFNESNRVESLECFQNSLTETDFINNITIQ